MESVRLFPYLFRGYLLIGISSWEPLEEKPEPGQWEYFGKSVSAAS